MLNALYFCPSLTLCVLLCLPRIKVKSTKRGSMSLPELAFVLDLEFLSRLLIKLFEVSGVLELLLDN